MEAAESLFECLEQVPDPRRARGVRHPFQAILRLTLLGLVCGQTTMAHITLFARMNWPALKEPLGFLRDHPPHPTTISRTLAGISHEQLQKALTGWVAHMVADLYRLADWLAECRVETVVMESTGVYWIPLFGVLGGTRLSGDAGGPQAHQERARVARPTCVDCQWLQQLHTYGLLSGAFRPGGDIRRLRSYLRQRAMLVEYASHRRPAYAESA